MASRIDGDGDKVIVQCPSCASENRVPLARLTGGPVCGRCKAGLAVSTPLTAGDETFEAVIRSSALPVLVDFWAPWCGPCRMVAPEVEQVARQGAGRVLVLKVNSDENPIVSSGYGIRSIPSLLVFLQGKEVRREIGAMRAPQILALLGL